MPARPALRFLAALALVPACYVPAFAAGSLVKPLGVLTLVAVILVSATVAFAIAALMIFLRRRSAADFGACAVNVRSAAKWFAIASGLALPVVLAVQLAGERPPEFIRALDVQTAFLLFVVGASIQEELIFRGVMLGIFNRALQEGRWIPPVALSGIMFGLLHLSVGPATAVAATGLGLLAGYARFRTQSLVTAVLVHAAFNLTSLLVGLA